MTEYRPDTDSGPSAVPVFWQITNDKRQMSGPLDGSAGCPPVCRPPFTTYFLDTIRTLVTLDLPALPFVGCMYRSDYSNTFIINVTGPPLIIALMAALAVLGLQTRQQVWRNSILFLFLIYPKASMARFSPPFSSGRALRRHQHLPVFTHLLSPPTFCATHLLSPPTFCAIIARPAR